MYAAHRVPQVYLGGVLALGFSTVGAVSPSFAQTTGGADAGQMSGAAGSGQMTTDDRDDDSGKWGLVGLLGLAGLAGLRRRDDHVNTTTRTRT